MNSEPDTSRAKDNGGGRSWANRRVQAMLADVPHGELEILPTGGPVDITVRPPGSKSITNRALVCAALSEGVTTLTDILFADDTVAMIEGLTALGIEIEPRSDGASVTITGSGGAREVDEAVVHARLSGTTARFVSPVAALLTTSTILDGDEPLRRRPMGQLFDAMRTLGAGVDKLGPGEGLPVRIEGDGFSGGPVTISGDVSSQFLSALLLSAPAMDRGIDVTITGELVSTPYVDMTLSVMGGFGARSDGGVNSSGGGGAVSSGGGGAIGVSGGGYSSPGRYRVEPDASAASYFMGAAAICGGSARIEGLGTSSLQGDIRFAEVLEQMGMEVTWTGDSVEVRRTGDLNGVDVDMGDISDVAQTFAVVATQAVTPSRVTGIGFIRAKETDRIAAVVNELRRLGIDAREEDDGFVIHPGEPKPGLVHTYDDHRMAMSFALLGLRFPGIRIADPHCVAKTYPGFWHDLGQGLPLDEEMSQVRVIAIDGPAGSGKSTIGRALAERIGLRYLDTGAMYRAVAFAAIESNVAVGDAAGVGKVARSIELAVGNGRVTVNGRDATDEIRGPEVSAVVSTVAALPPVRDEMRRRQREWAVENGGGVIEGRDIGSVVFPDAVLKVYLTASPEVRAARRASQIGELDTEAVEKQLARRDTADRSRSDSPLVEPDGAVTVDSSPLSIDEVVDLIAGLVDARSEPTGGS